MYTPISTLHLFLFLFHLSPLYIYWYLTLHLSRHSTPIPATPDHHYLQSLQIYPGPWTNQSLPEISRKPGLTPGPPALFQANHDLSWPLHTYPSLSKPIQTINVITLSRRWPVKTARTNGPRQMGPSKGPPTIRPRQIGPVKTAPSKRPRQKGPRHNGPRQKGPRHYGPSQKGPRHNGPSQKGPRHKGQ